MADNHNTTITDKNKFSVDAFDDKRIKALPTEDKKIFEIFKNSMLEIMPFEDDKFDDLAIQYAENFAFIATKAVESASLVLLTKINTLQEKINNLEEKITDNETNIETLEETNRSNALRYE